MLLDGGTVLKPRIKALTVKSDTCIDARAFASDLRAVAAQNREVDSNWCKFAHLACSRLTSQASPFSVGLCQGFMYPSSICIYVHMYICIHVHTYRKYKYMSMYIHVCVYKYRHVHV